MMIGGYWCGFGLAFQFSPRSLVADAQPHANLLSGVLSTGIGDFIYFPKHKSYCRVSWLISRVFLHAGSMDGSKSTLAQDISVSYGMFRSTLATLGTTFICMHHIFAYLGTRQRRTRRANLPRLEFSRFAQPICFSIPIRDYFDGPFHMF